MGKKQKAGEKGNAVNYTTRNQALKKLQLRLAQFRRLCILKGIHPREPKKKRQGQNKTYYHVKDINFLLHEPLLDRFREIRAYDKKVTKAKAKKQHELAQRLQKRRPGYQLDHLVKERYPSFTDALRDLDDPLTLVHLFASLPAEKTRHISRKLVDGARRLSLEFQAYVTRTNSLRKSFVSVKGIYYQAEIMGQTVTWITPHALSQHMPDDVDYRVMVTFLEFYETMLEFVCFKLYHSLGLKYPPTLDSKGDSAATGLMAVMHDIASHAGGVGLLSTAAPEADPTSASVQASKDRLGSLAAKLGDLSEAPAPKDPADADEARDVADADEAEEAEVGALMTRSTALAEDEECGQLFKGLVFFLAREVNRESLLFVIKAFGGAAGWQGPESPIDESDPSITHHVCDRPSQKHKFLSVEYVQPQWVYDSLNFRVVLPTDAYSPGAKPPPHVSPFVQDEDEDGYVPDYMQKLKQLQAAAQGAVDASAQDDRDAVAAPGAAGADGAEHDEEQQYTAELAAELAGVPFSKASHRAEKIDESDDSDGDEEAQEESGSEEEEEEAEAKMPAKLSKQELKDSVLKKVREDDDGVMLDAMLPRKQKRLYEAMQIGIARKQAKVNEIKDRKNLLAKKKPAK